MEARSARSTSKDGAPQVADASIASGPVTSVKPDGSLEDRPQTRGRPRIHDDGEILDAALRAFATAGYHAMSVRSLNAELGLSHGAINQRFASKEALYFAAIDHGFVTFFADIVAERARRPPAVDAIDELHEQLRAFLLAAARRPELGRLMNQEGLQASERLDYVVREVIMPSLRPIVELIDQLASDGIIYPTSDRMLFFLVAHGAEAPYTLTALSDAFDQLDGPLDDVAHADAVTELIMRGLRT